MFMNLHTLPASQHLYTVAVTSQPVEAAGGDLFYDELDVVAPRYANTQDVLLAITPLDRESYAGQRVIGVIDQSDAYTLWEDPSSLLRL